jgi:hypothetical protein
MTDITGTWLGTYWQRGTPTRFEATFVQASHHLSGRIADDGALGEASLQGEVVGRQIRFTKRYLSNASYSIQYSGTLAEDGDYIQGNWRVNAAHAGPWEAHRSQDQLTQEFQSFLARRPALVR